MLEIVKRACVPAVLLALAGCTTFAQGTSGQAYLDRYHAQQAAAGVGKEAAKLDPAIEAAASVEPLLTFPARIGIARIGIPIQGHPQLVPLSAQETELWLAAAEKLGPGFGEFVPISPLVAELSRQIACDAGACAKSIIDEIRVASARQHLDAVLIYELATKVERYDNPLWLTHFTLIGMAIAPSEHAEIDGMGQAMLLDVRNAYVYGFTSAVVEDAVKVLDTLSGIRESVAGALPKAELAAAAALTDRAVELGHKVRTTLEASAAKR